MAIKSNPQMAVTAWKNGVGAAGTKYIHGVNNSADWAAAATAPQAVQARNAGLMAAINNGTIDAGIQKLGTGVWRTITAAKAQNWQTGVNSPQAQQNATAGFNRLFGYLQQAQSAIASTPRGGFAENMQRMVTNATVIHDAAQADKGY